METKSSVAVGTNLRKKLKKLAALLDMTQCEIIAQAVAEYEKKILTIHKGSAFDPVDSDTEAPKAPKTALVEGLNKNSDEFYADQLKKATILVWKQDPSRKKRQEQLYDGGETIDDFIISSWNSGLDL